MNRQRPNEDLAVRRSLVGLTIVTGVIDAVSFLGFDRVFTANMTGNVVFLGFALAGSNGISAARSIAALGAFGCGGLCGGLLLNGRDRAAPDSLLLAMSIESLLLSLATVATVKRIAAPSAIFPYAVIAFMAFAMGLRNSVVRRLSVPDLSTTVLTMTITALAADSRIAGGNGRRSGRRVLAVASMCAGGCAGALLLHTLGVTAALATATLVVLALASIQIISRRRSA